MKRIAITPLVSPAGESLETLAGAAVLNGVFAAESSALSGSELLDPRRVAEAKQAFTCRRVDPRHAKTLVRSAPRPGDLVLAEVVRKRQHPRIELANGRKAGLYPGDEIVVAYGHRYASDQFEALAPEDLEPCHLVASGGVASRVVERHRSVRPATEIRPLGLLGDADGQVLNLSAYALPLDPPQSRAPLCLGVVGSSMNAGKTTSAARLIRAFRCAGRRVGAAKITGTGSGGDYWKFKDAGARDVVDFTDAGHVSTYKVDVPELCRISAGLIGHLQSRGADVVVLEIADGVFQEETAGLLHSDLMRGLVDGYLLAVTDSLSAKAGVDWMMEAKLPLLGLCGTLTRSPLATREASQATGVPVLTLQELGHPEVAESLFVVASSAGDRGVSSR